MTLYQHDYHVAEIASSFLDANALNAFDPTVYDIDALVGRSQYSLRDTHNLLTNRTAVQVDTRKCIKDIRSSEHRDQVLLPCYHRQSKQPCYCVGHGTIQAIRRHIALAYVGQRRVR